MTDGGELAELFDSPAASALSQPSTTGPPADDSDQARRKCSDVFEGEREVGLDAALTQLRADGRRDTGPFVTSLQGPCRARL
jgi:hypothetical protein